jgi:hypothetical protein
MKSCPTCNRTFIDTFAFCSEDGSTLSASYDSEPTLRISFPRNTDPTEIPSSNTLLPLTIAGPLPPTQLPISQKKSRKSYVFIVVTIGIAAGLGALGTWAWFERRGRPSTDSVAVSTGNSNSVATDTSVTKGEVKAALDGWLKTIVNRDFNGHMKYYADMLDIYYRKSNVNLSYVHEVNLGLFEKYSVTEMSISNLKIDVNPTSGRVITTFDKTFNFRGDNAFNSGAVQSEFRWEKFNGAWRITSERDLQLYYVTEK